MMQQPEVSAINEETYRQRYLHLRNWYQSEFTERRIESVSGGMLRLALPRDWSDNSPAIVVNGRTEFVEKYLELAMDLHHRGLSVVLYDHCGQGDSDRLLGDRQKGYIDSFRTYVRDLGRVIDSVRGSTGDVPVRIISHSMGGTVAVLYALHRPERVGKMVLVSPMCAIRTGSKIPQFLIRPFVAVGCRVGFGDRYMPTRGPYQPDLSFDDNLFTSDAFRFYYNQFLTNSLEFAPLGGPTLQWLHEAYKAMRQMNAGAEQFRTPHLVFTAAADRVIKPAMVERFCARSAKGTHKQYEEVRHELFMENDAVRDDLLRRISGFLGRAP